MNINNLHDDALKHIIYILLGGDISDRTYLTLINKRLNLLTSNLWPKVLRSKLTAVDYTGRLSTVRDICSHIHTDSRHIVAAGIYGYNNTGAFYCNVVDSFKVYVTSSNTVSTDGIHTVYAPSGLSTQFRACHVSWTVMGNKYQSYEVLYWRGKVGSHCPKADEINIIRQMIKVVTAVLPELSGLLQEP